MPLDVGSRLGVFEITGRLGEGGMGVVYRATDTTLHRDVALKVLPDAFATDPERLARFQREAQVLASLNHPNIAQIHGLEESGEQRLVERDRAFRDPVLECRAIVTVRPARLPFGPDLLTSGTTVTPMPCSVPSTTPISPRGLDCCFLLRPHRL